MYGPGGAAHNLFGTDQSGGSGIAPQEIPRRGSTLRPTEIAGRHHRRQRKEDGAEMIEFAFVVILLIALVYGIVSVGITLAVKATITQAAADGARAGIVDNSTTAGFAAALDSASSDLGWVGSGSSGTATCSSSTSCTMTPCGPSSSGITCTATKATCPSASTQVCLTVNVSYPYTAHPLFPVAPGLGIINPSTIASSSTLQWNPTS
jgi:Flp pilus assembly protein TadG